MTTRKSTTGPAKMPSRTPSDLRAAMRWHARDAATHTPTRAMRWAAAADAMAGKDADPAPWWPILFDAPVGDRRDLLESHYYAAYNLAAEAVLG